MIESAPPSGYHGSKIRRVAQEVVQVERLIFVCTSEVLVQFPLLAVEENVKADTPFTLLVADAPFMLDYAPTKTHWKCRARTIGE